MGEVQLVCRFCFVRAINCSWALSCCVGWIRALSGRARGGYFGDAVKTSNLEWVSAVALVTRVVSGWRTPQGIRTGC